MQNLKFVALPVPEIIMRYIGILSLHYPHTSGSCRCRDAGIFPRSPRSLARRRTRPIYSDGSTYNVTGESTIAVAHIFTVKFNALSPEIWGVPVAPDSPCWVSQSNGLKLFGREIIFEVFQPVWKTYLNVTDRRTDRRTDGQHTMAIPRFALKCIAR